MLTTTESNWPPQLQLYTPDEVNKKMEDFRNLIERSETYKSFVKCDIPPITYNKNTKNAVNDLLRKAPLEDAEKIRQVLITFPLDELELLYDFHKRGRKEFYHSSIFKKTIYQNKREAWSIVFLRHKENLGQYLAFAIQKKKDLCLF